MTCLCAGNSVVRSELHPSGVVGAPLGLGWRGRRCGGRRRPTGAHRHGAEHRQRGALPLSPGLQGRRLPGAANHLQVHMAPGVLESGARLAFAWTEEVTRPIPKRHDWKSGVRCKLDCRSSPLKSMRSLIRLGKTRPHKDSHGESDEGALLQGMQHAARQEAVPAGAHPPTPVGNSSGARVAQGQGLSRTSSCTSLDSNESQHSNDNTNVKRWGHGNSDSS